MTKTSVAQFTALLEPYVRPAYSADSEYSTHLTALRSRVTSITVLSRSFSAEYRIAASNKTR